MLKDLTIGQFFPAKSPLHRMDPRAKLLLLIVYIVFIFIAGNPFSLGLMTLSVAAVLLLSRVPLKIYLKNIKSIWVIVLLTALLNALYVDEGALLCKFWMIQITAGGVQRAVFMAVRIVLLILTSAVLTYTTTPTALTDAIERLLSPLRFVGLGTAVHTMAMMMTIALRFIPTLIEETEKIMNAQKARGADMESGGLMKRVKALLPVLIPLLVSSFRRAYDLAEAMECRCYNGGKGRQRMTQLRFGRVDLVCALLSIAVCTGAVVLNIFL
ncbi:MAG: energy-coupling factor transporter transmembrane protein EcfT [Clostridiales bacterium]|nr:energy-coupling factor transporter transmembrane protein EcfT [Clostridiales bacterium]